MTQEEKQLLLKDLCGRLPYGIIVHFHDIDVDDYDIDVDDYDRQLIGEDLDFIELDRRNCKPYLRLMSSMTEEERNEATQFEINNLGPIGFNWDLLVSNSSKLVNWLTAHHFDYRGLIEKGLALEAPEGMYKTE